MSALQHFFDSENEFMPRGNGFLWYPEVLWTHVISDALIAFSYFSIPIALMLFTRKRPDIPFRPTFWLFSSLLLLCGLTHLFGIWTIWTPDYGQQGILKAATAIVALFTAITAWRILPKALNLPSPENLIEANEQLQQTNERIEQQVAERTAALEAAKLQLEENERETRAAYEQARQANVAKSEFLAHMSHEIRTPLSAVTTIAELLPRMGSFNAKQHELIDTMQIGARSLLDLINDILDISKIEAGEFELHECPFEWDELIDDTARVMSVRAEEKGITLRTNTGALTGKCLMGDRARLRQVLMNLMGNAVKFTKEGEVALNARVANATDGTPHIYIAISDTGIGIPADQQEVVFDKFRQSSASATSNSSGTGLGLAITRHLVGLMGGDITVKSTEGQGSTFTLNIPLKEADCADVETDETAVSKPTPVAATAHKILLVEDYPGNILVATILLDELGYAYDVANNGEEALDMQAQGTVYYAVLMDVNMPKMNGLEATAQWRKREETRGEPRTPIIGLTAHALAGDDVKCLEAGMDAYLPKPLTIESLQIELDRLHDDERSS